VPRPRRMNRPRRAGDQPPTSPAARSCTTTAARRCRARFRQSGSRPTPRAR
jgi:hypothetical protein